MPVITSVQASPHGSGDDPKSQARRAVILASLVLPLASPVPAGARSSERRAHERDVAGLIERADRANAAFMRGDMEAWHRIAGPIAEDFTLMQPFGGPFSRGFDASPERLEALARYFTAGETSVEVVETYASPDLVVLALIERQRARVGGLPEQDWSLRVTLVYRKRAGDWELVHRHADPLVRHVGLDKAAALARGS